MPAPFTPPAIELDPDGTYIQSNTRNVPVIRRRSGRRPLGPNRLYRGTWIPPFGYPSVAQSNRGFLGSCAFYWRQVLTAGQRAAWSANPGPGTTGFQRFMSWQKYNQGRKMVNPRIDLWDRVAPFPTAPGSYSPPTLIVDEMHLWLSAPGNNSTYLQAKLATDPPNQYVHVGVTPFHKFPKQPGARNFSTCFQLVTAESYTGLLSYDWFPASGPGYYGTIRLWFDPLFTGTFTYQVEWVFAANHGIDQELFAPTQPWVSVQNSFAANGPETVHHDVVIDVQAALAGTNIAVINHGPTFIQNGSTQEIQTTAGSFSVDRDQARNHRIIIQSRDAWTNLWEYPYHVIGIPLAPDRCWVRLIPVDIATGSAGTPYQTLVVPE